jgi:NhaA family Na+:H+ antiporter
MVAFARPWLHRIGALLHREASSGVILVAVAVIAMAIANGPAAAAFHGALDLPIGVHVGSWAIDRSVHFWIDDGLMTLFFFFVGLEIRREIHDGTLSTLRQAALPVGAAAGGMIAPAVLYLVIAGREPANLAGWGIPMATDIAVAVGILSLLGDRVPASLRILLLALAIIDDIGSILVIAIFYSNGLESTGFAIALLGIAAILALQRLGAKRPLLYVLPGVVVWAGILRSGVHPTIAGVILGLLTPAAAARRLQTGLHPWVAFGIMPLFALANAGITIEAETLSVSALGAGIVVGLLVGKPVGIVTACFAMVRSRSATLPRDVGARELFVLGVVAGIGFTMSLFMAGLAFPEGPKLNGAKLAVLVASTCAMVLAVVIGRALLPSASTKDESASATLRTP